jgi:GxxExxY protein
MIREVRMDDEELERLNPITGAIIGCAHLVLNTLGAGFLEKVYENALAHELRKTGLKVVQQQPIQVYYDSVVVGDYAADLKVADQVLVELKAVKALDEIHRAQCINYLKATGLKLCLLLNFGRPKLEIQRIALTRRLAVGEGEPQMHADRHG